MPHLKFFKEIDKNSVPTAGGKGASLGEMTKAGIPVPPGFVVLADAFDRFIEETELKEEITARIAEVDPADTNTIDKASNILRDVINDTPMPEDLATEILDAFDTLFAPTPSAPALPAGGLPLGQGERVVAVRSSATAEDSSIASWAGELETYLNTTKEGVVERVKHCWSSLFTPRAIFYRFEKNLADSYVSVAVVVQKMVQSEISGIAFTVHPVTEDPDQMIIEAGHGLGEAIVGGLITPDSYVVSKSEMTIIDINVGHQTRRLEKTRNPSSSELRRAGKSQDTNEENTWVELGEEGNKQKLSGRQIIELAELCKKIEAHYGFPCDIEWAFEGGKFYVTQSRPITTLKQSS